MGRKARKDALRKALYSKDPYRIAAAIELPLLSIKTATASQQSSSGRNLGRTYNESLLDGSGADWSGVLNSLLEASDAALEVSDSSHCNCFEYHSSGPP